MAYTSQRLMRHNKVASLPPESDLVAQRDVLSQIRTKLTCHRNTLKTKVSYYFLTVIST